ncbi:MAG: DUF3106 domain-containing protein [Myxococcales bacterium]
MRSLPPIVLAVCLALPARSEAPAADLAPRRQSLSEAERAELLRRWKEAQPLPASDRAGTRLTQLQALPEGQQAAILRKLRAFDGLEPQARRAFVRSLQSYLDTPAEQRTKVYEMLDRWQRATPEERERFHERGL